VGWRFRKSFRLAPGVRLNVSGRGVSATIGSGWASVSLSDRGAIANVHLPGTGLSYRERLTAPPSGEVVPAVHPAEPARPLPSSGRVEIQSASTYELTSEALSQFQKLLVDAATEQQDLDRELSRARPDAAAKSERCRRWSDGIVLRRLMKAKFHEITAGAEEATARLAELEEQRRLATVATHIEVSEVLRRPFGRLCDAFSAVTESQRIWDTLAVQKTDRFRERTTAEHSIERKAVNFSLAASDLLVCEWKVPRLANANGGDLYLYPGFVLYRVSSQSFAVIDAREVRLSFANTRFLEEEGVPSDSEVVGETWKKANKDGTPDRRFTNNYRIPITKYAELAFTTASGLNEIYMISNCSAAEKFSNAWHAYVAAFELPA
jgi:hypothetical protein